MVLIRPKMTRLAGALELIAAVGHFAEEKNHHPDLDRRYNRVFIHSPRTTRAAR